MNPGTTLAQLPTLLTNPGYRAQLLRRVSTPAVLDYFTHEYNPLTPKAQAALFGSLMNKVGKFLRDPVLGKMVSQSGTTVDFHTILARRQILLVRLYSKWTEATALLGTAIVLQLFEAALSRSNLPEQMRPPFAVYADEFHKFATPVFGQLFEEVRKYNIATTIGHQRRGQLSDDLQDAVKGAVNIVTFQTMTDDASEMAREYRANRGNDLPYDLFRWAKNHSDPTIRAAGACIELDALAVEIRYAEDTRPLSYHERLRFFERRLREAVRDGNARATPYPRQFWYGVYDLQVGSYGSLAEGFAVLRDRLLATKQIDAAELAQLPTGTAAAKLEEPDGSIRQYLLRIPPAVHCDHSLIVKTIFDYESPLPEVWPAGLPPHYVAAGLRARRIRERTRRRYAPAEVAPPAAAIASTPAPPPRATGSLPQFEVELP
jgi:hypothetical protein